MVIISALGFDRHLGSPGSCAGIENTSTFEACRGTLNIDTPPC
jgi:hypothetical protein